MTPAQAASMSAQMEKGFYPYDYNGGTCLAIAGKDFVVVAGDTRMSTGFNIKSRHVSKLFKLTGDTVLATAGFRGDITTLQKLLRVKLTQYEHQHGESMGVSAVGQLLGNTLYGRRFFPYYTWNVVGGLDGEGVGCVYSYDPVGNYERVRVSVTGSGESLIQPLLDNQLERQHQQLAAKPPPLHVDLSVDATVDLVKDAFVSASERTFAPRLRRNLWWSPRKASRLNRRSTATAWVASPPPLPTFPSTREGRAALQKNRLPPASRRPHRRRCPSRCTRKYTNQYYGSSTRLISAC